MAVPLSLGPVHHLPLADRHPDDRGPPPSATSEPHGFRSPWTPRLRADDPHDHLATHLLQDGIVMVNGECCSGCARWTPSGPATASTRFAVAWTI